jgi:HSP20 family protein
MSNLTVKRPDGFLRPFLSDLFEEPFFRRNLWSDLPAVNVAETDKEYSIELAVPGFKKEDLHVKLESNILTISAETKSEKNEEKKDYTRREYSSNSFSRSFSLYDNVKESDINARYENGILYLTLPKSNTNSKVTKEIKVA